MIKVLRVGLGPHCYSIYSIVESIQKKAKKLLSILLTEPKEKRVSHLLSQEAVVAATHPGEHACKALTYSQQSEVHISESGS